jgi:hypothetical protein
MRLHATGVKGEAGWNASCGATFISPHYVITAAHCVVEAANVEMRPASASSRTRARCSPVKPNGHTLPVRSKVVLGPESNRCSLRMPYRFGQVADVALLGTPSRSGFAFVAFRCKALVLATKGMSTPPCPASST